jgi:hypothetical protein
MVDNSAAELVEGKAEASFESILISLFSDVDKWCVPVVHCYTALVVGPFGVYAARRTTLFVPLRSVALLRISKYLEAFEISSYLVRRV